MQAVPVVITRPEYQKAAAWFDAQSEVAIIVTEPAEDTLAKAIAASGAVAAILGVEHYTNALYQALPRGGVIARFGVGHDGIDMEKASRAGIYVTNTPGVLEDAVAEHTIALILALSKELPRFMHAALDGQWSPVPTTELRGKTLAILGCGGIGRRVARAASCGFGMTVVGYNPRLSQRQALLAEWGFTEVTADLDAALESAAYVSLHMPATAATRHIVNAEFLERLAPGTILVNTARGALVDEVALYAALRRGALRAAALDVFEREPYVPRTPEQDLRTLPNVLLTPHVASGTREACVRVAQASVQSIRAIRSGCTERISLLNRDLLASMQEAAGLENITP